MKKELYVMFRGCLPSEWDQQRIVYQILQENKTIKETIDAINNMKLAYNNKEMGEIPAELKLSMLTILGEFVRDNNKKELDD